MHNPQLPKRSNRPVTITHPHHRALISQNRKKLDTIKLHIKPKILVFIHVVNHPGVTPPPQVQQATPREQQLSQEGNPQCQAQNHQPYTRPSTQAQKARSRKSKKLNTTIPKPTTALAAQINILTHEHPPCLTAVYVICASQLPGSAMHPPKSPTLTKPTSIQKRNLKTTPIPANHN
eukprot:gene3433-2384_t